MSTGISTNFERHPKWKRLTPQLKARWDAATARGAFALDHNERPWRDRVPFLLSKGYRLRNRFQPNWVPSWKGTDIHPKDCEDSIRFTGGNVIDGKRISDNKIVAIKRLRLSDPAAVHEVDMVRLASSFTANDNRCVPFVDALEDSASDSLYLVTEWTSRFDEPEFFNGAEIVDFMQQLLAGLCFLHKQGIVHRDLARADNIRMDARPLTPGVTPHPQLPLHALDGRPVSEPLRRSEAPRIRYFIDGFSRAMKVDDPDQARLPTYVGSLPPPPGVGGFGEGDGGWSTAIPHDELAHSSTSSYSTGGLSATPGPGTTTFPDVPDTPGPSDLSPPLSKSRSTSRPEDDDDAATVVELVAVSTTSPAAPSVASPATTLTGTPAAASKDASENTVEPEKKQTDSEADKKIEDLNEAAAVALPLSGPTSAETSPRGSVDVHTTRRGRQPSGLDSPYNQSPRGSIDSTALLKGKMTDSPRGSPAPLNRIQPALGSPFVQQSADKGKQRAGVPPPVSVKDPFKMDVYDLGTFFNRELVQKYAHLEYLQPLIDEMIRPSPHMRYTAEEALVFLRLIRAHGMDWFQQKWGLTRQDGTVGDAVVNGLYTGLNMMGIRKFRWQARVQDPMRPDKDHHS